MKYTSSIVGRWALCALLAPLVVQAESAVSGLSEKAHISGPKIDAKDLQGKVVLIEFWGLNCPPCRASLPHMQELYEKYGKRGNFVLLGSHCQTRDDEKILALLKEAGVTYPVYEFLKVDGMPAFRGIPHAAVIDHKGTFVTSGGLTEVLAALSKVISNAPLPIPGSLLGGLEVKHNKGVEQRLVLGQNIEPLLAQLNARAKTDNEAGHEAAEIVKACEAALAEKETAIRSQLATEPSLALDAMAKFARTCPSKASQFSSEWARLNGNPSVKRLVAFRQDLQKMEAQKPKTKTAVKSAVQQSSFKRQQYAPLCENADSAVQTEAKALMASFDALVEGWNTPSQAGN
jgi:thiol-disulfide isomerase/thioredoxin